MQKMICGVHACGGNMVVEGVEKKRTPHGYSFHNGQSIVDFIQVKVVNWACPSCGDKGTVAIQGTLKMKHKRVSAIDPKIPIMLFNPN